MKFLSLLGAACALAVGALAADKPAPAAAVTTIITAKKSTIAVGSGSIALAKGTNRSGNYGDFENADATAALAAYAKAGTAQDAQNAINTLSKVMSDQVPDAPIMYAAGWYEYNTTNYSGWVDKDNQYVDPSPNPANVEYVE